MSRFTAHPSRTGTLPLSKVNDQLKKLGKEKCQYNQHTEKSERRRCAPHVVLAITILRIIVISSCRPGACSVLPIRMPFPHCPNLGRVCFPLDSRFAFL